MAMDRRLLAAGWIPVLALAGTAAAASSKPTSWAAPQIRVVAAAGVMDGTNVATFRPADPLTAQSLEATPPEPVLLNVGHGVATLRDSEVSNNARETAPSVLEVAFTAPEMAPVTISDVVELSLVSGVMAELFPHPPK